MRRKVVYPAAALCVLVALSMSTAFAAGLDVRAGNLQVFGMPATLLPFSGSFVIGDRNAAVGSSVTFWSSQWSDVNGPSGGPAPSSFKGFADRTTTNPPSCGAQWSSVPDNSSGPPASVPTYMAVIVTGTVGRSGSSTIGDTVHVAVVKTDAGYSTGPGHVGTGTVVGVLC